MKIIDYLLKPAAVLALVLAFTGCDAPNQSTDSTEDAPDDQTVRVAIAELQPTEGNEVSGTVTFTKVEDGIRVVAELSGFGDGPNQRGFHIHEKGDCSAPDATSAGGHFNPEDLPHGAPDSDERHVGDLGNIKVEADGTARKEFIDSMLTFEGPNSILDKAVIVHEQEDDLESQPTGDAGGRVACGVIQIAEYEN